MQGLLDIAIRHRLRLSPSDGSIGFNSNLGPAELVEWDSSHYAIYLRSATFQIIQLLRSMGCKVVQRGDEDVLLSFLYKDIDTILEMLIVRKAASAAK